MTILQRNLNRSTFVVWEMKKNVSVVNPLIQRRLVFGVGWPLLRIIGPIFDATTTTAAYMEIFNIFVNQLDDKKLSIRYFQQDGATSHTSHANMAENQWFFGDRVISKKLWPLRSPDLTPPDYSLWGYLKGRVYQNKPRTIDALKVNITEKNSGSDSGRTGKDFLKYGAPGFNPVWTQMVVTSRTCYDVTFLTQRTYSCSNFVAISSLVLELWKKCRVR